MQGGGDLRRQAVALIAGGVFFLLLALSGVMPSRLKIGDNEAEWQGLAESVERQVPRVGALLDSGGVSLDAILTGRAPASGANLAQVGVRVGALAEDVRLLDARAGQDFVPPDALLEIAKWYLAQQDWPTGARYLDAYVKRAEADWETYFILGVAYANSRQGERTDRAAVRAYDEALMRWPDEPPIGMTARLYSHRSGMKKRLGRLREAKADAEIAVKLAETDIAEAGIAETDYEYVDAIYNLACIEAMFGNREAALNYVAELSRLGATSRIPGHLNDYFRSLRDDPEFRELLNGGRSRRHAQTPPSE